MKREESVKIARRLVAEGKIKQEYAEEMFPELMEPQDVKIMKSIRSYILSHPDSWKDFQRDELVHWLEKHGEEVNGLEPVEIECGRWYFCVKDFYRGGKKQCSKGDIVQALGGKYMMSLDQKEAAEYFYPVYVTDIFCDKKYNYVRLYEPMVGMTIEDAVIEAIAYAKSDKNIVILNMNDTLIQINEGTTKEDAIKQYRNRLTFHYGTRK